jgi:hypothetical protein
MSVSLTHQITRLGMELGLAVNDYNSHVTDSFDEIIKVTLAYMAKVKEAVRAKVIPETELNDYFALVGQSWASIVGRIENEYTES